MDKMQQAFDNTWMGMETAPRDGTHIMARYYDVMGKPERIVHWSTDRYMVVPAAGNAKQSIEDGWVDVCTGEPLDEPLYWKHVDKRILIEPKHILVKNHGTKDIELSKPAFQYIETPMEMLLTELHFKSDGTTDNRPSFCLVFDKWDPETNMGLRIYAQVSLDRLNDALSELGYTLYQP